MRKFFNNQWLFIKATHLGKLIYSLILVVLFLWLANWYNPLVYVAGALAIYPLGLTLVLFAHAWFINPWRAYQERKKKKNK